MLLRKLKLRSVFGAVRCTCFVCGEYTKPKKPCSDNCTASCSR